MISAAMASAIADCASGTWTSIAAAGAFSPPPHAGHAKTVDIAPPASKFPARAPGWGGVSTGRGRWQRGVGARTEAAGRGLVSVRQEVRPQNPHAASCIRRLWHGIVTSHGRESHRHSRSFTINRTDRWIKYFNRLNIKIWILKDHKRN